MEQDDALDPVVTWQVLPVYPKVAILFLQGIASAGTAKLVQEMLTQLQPGVKNDLHAMREYETGMKPISRRRGRKHL